MRDVAVFDQDGCECGTDDDDGEPEETPNGVMISIDHSTDGCSGRIVGDDGCDDVCAR